MRRANLTYAMHSVKRKLNGRVDAGYGRERHTQNVAVTSSG
ncbi:hypothetical protein OKW46_001053 [Paraburkholderia sp. WSM4179]|nr:hypothetical protein [Paraburkholderia sp. WSM4179]